MLFRLVVLFAFTILAGVASWYRSPEADDFYEWATWATLGSGYLLTLVFSWALPRWRDLSLFARIQTTLDVALAAIVVQLTGGVDSGFVFLYLVAILGAATMGDRRQTWVATLACVLVYVAMTALQSLQVLLPLTPTGELTRLAPAEVASAAARTVAAMGGIGILSAYLNVQLSSSVRQVGSLRALNENIVRSLTSGLLTVDVDGRILFANPTALEILGLSQEPTGARIDALLPGVGALLHDSGDPRDRFDLEARRSDGRTVHLGLSCAPLLDPDGHFLGHVVHFQDVTELHELTARARRNERLAALGGLAASVAHEVRNPLAAISGSAELLSGAVSSEDDRRLLGVIQRESSRLERTVTELLAFTRPKPPEPVALELTGALGEIVTAFRADPANADTRVVLKAPGPVTCEVDPSQFSQLVWNLLRNAVEAMHGRGAIEIGVDSDQEAAVLTFQDDGPGIDPERRDRVFEPFFTTKEQGSGFGLAIVFRIVQDHDGEIGIVSRPGRGACFEVRLPLHRERVPTPAPDPR
jgi:two-component system sensor histidine kinase PilS (NtrC family)